VSTDRTLPSVLAQSPIAGLDGLVNGARAALFVGLWCTVWIGLEAFGSLSSNDLLALTTGNDFWTYVLFGLAASLAVIGAWARRRAFWTAFLDPLLIALIGYIALNVLVSVDFSASLRRFVLSCAVLIVSALVCLLPRDRDEFARLIVGTALFVVALSYAGVLLLPELSVHQATDLIEERLAGDWRGVFGHKNIAGGVFSCMVFIGIFAVRAGLPVAGTALAVLSAIFVIMTGAKSSIIILATVLLLTALTAGIRSVALRAIITYLPLIGLLTIGLGSVLSPAIGALVAALPVDASFTGRADVWAFALEKFAERPWTGFGFQAFWTQESTRFGVEDSTQWAGSAANGHNSFLDTALNLGLIGLVLTIAYVVVQPFRDDARARRIGADPATRTLWLQLWMFGIYLGCMESFFFLRADPIWFTLLVAVTGMRLTARLPVSSAAP
jgi:O-antigen ligase